MLGLKRKIEQALRFFHFESWFRLLFLCVVVGIIAGLAAFVFDQALAYVQFVLLDDWLFQTNSPDYAAWPMLVVPAIGGGLAGAFAVWLAPEATGHGTDAVIRAFHQEKGAIRARVPFMKAICSILSIGSGGSAGKEGPIVQMGAGFGSNLASLLRLSIRDRRILMLAGVAGGVGAIFKAPLGGALFAAEVLYRQPDFEHDAVIPGVISSVTAYSVFTSIEGYTRILYFRDPTGNEIPPVSFPSPHGGSFAELAHYAILSILCALVAFLFVKIMRMVSQGVFNKLPIPRFTKPAIGGLLLGALALALLFGLRNVEVPAGQVLGASHPSHIMVGGHGYLQDVLTSALDETQTDPYVALKLGGFLAVVVLAKILATAFTIGSGGSGGLLFPSLFLGGITGAAYAKFLRALHGFGWLPDSLAMTPQARAGMILVGMGGVFAACTKTPIASLVMVSEITGSYGLVVPLMLTCVSAYLLSHSFTMNEEQVAGIADSPAHRGDFQRNILEDIKVSEAIIESAKPEIFPAQTPFRTILERIKGSRASTFPFVDEKGCLLGVFSLNDIRQIMNEKELGSLVVAGDLGTTDVATVTLHSNLDEALRKFTQKNADELPVVEESASSRSGAHSMLLHFTRRPRGPVGSKRVIGMLSRRDLIAAYHRKLHALQLAEAQENKGSHVFVEALAAPAEETAAETKPAEHSPDASQPTPEMLIDPPEQGH